MTQIQARQTATLGSRALDFAAISDSGALDMDLTVRSCHKSMITKQKKNIILKNKIKKIIKRKKKSTIPMNSALR